MREMKFRAWDKTNKSMLLPERDDRAYIFGSGDEGFDHLVQLLGRTNPEMPDLDNVELMQYTGLKDKNGNEVYEGDISKRYGEPSGKFIGVITWNNEEARYVWKSVEDGRELPLHNEEVIGNIYENKDLLN